MRIILLGLRRVCMCMYKYEHVHVYVCAGKLRVVDGEAHERVRPQACPHGAVLVTEMVTITPVLTEILAPARVLALTLALALVLPTA